MNLLKISAYIDNDYSCFVTAKKLHPELKPCEYVRFAPYYLSFRIFADESHICRRILDEIVGCKPKDISTVCLNNMSKVGYSVVPNVRELSRKKYVYSGTLSFISVAFRRMRTSIPLFGYQAIHSFVTTWAIIQYCANAIDLSEAKIMLNCLDLMYSAYTRLDYRRVDVMHTVPNMAYNESILEIEESE